MHSPLRNLAAALIVLVLVIRVLVPSGWMPSTERGFALNICTGMDTQTVWMDKSGKLHKEDPSKGKSAKHQPCAFAAAAIASDVAADPFHTALPPVALAVLTFADTEFLVGHGLAAPPPPAIGPPSYV